jgi:putative heme-binding domain-containing protein
MKFARASSVSIRVHPWLKIFFVILFAALFSLPTSAVEPWADKNLSVTNGLEIWLDASKEIAARTQNVKKGPLNRIATKLVNGGPLDIWHDASGNKRNLLQLIPSARPKFFRTPGGALVRFDGEDDFMAATGLEQEFDETTIFILAAPRTNQNNFNAFLSFNRGGENDFLTGPNIDLGNGAKKKFDFLNVEGPGFVGLKNVMTSAVPFGEPHVISVVAEAGTNDVRAWIDGIAQEKYGRKAREPKQSRKSGRAQNSTEDAAFSADQITVGARFFSNTSEPAHAQGFLDGDVLEVLVYHRILSEAERSDVEKYLKQKLVSKTPGREMAFLNTVTNPAPVQMFLPGFSARELPVELSNINNLDYREDGKLVALGYDGKIWILTDTDGDGLEDKASLFWAKETLRSPIGMALTPPNYAKGRGVFVPSKGKVSRIVDTNSDDVADEEIVVATGWPEARHNVDALGVAVDKDGSIYFGLGTASFTGAYLVDENGKSHYDLKDERGTIMKVSPDFKHREIVCTGIRYPVGMAFNANGDLFCTDQEGATWLPNGNPFDELLFIERGKHYGFPPRHPKYLPNVIDEPSVFDYAPQHQSTCGLDFNLPVGTRSTASEMSGKTFGPSWWRGDAFVAGYSRGKIFRTKLVKTDAGYVAQNQLIAALDMLPSDVCVTPGGDLLVSVHSGKPDWGSGPTGSGKVYKISYSDKEAPQPVAIWPSSPTETRIEFNRPLDLAQVKELAKQLTVTQGKYVSAGDPYETIRPGYQAVQNQLLEPRYAVKVLSTELSADGRSLIIRTEPRVGAVNYAISIPQKKPAANKSELRQQPTIELAQDLTGVEAEWQNTSGEKISTWLPHLDLSVNRAFTKPSAAHETFWSNLAKPGVLKIRTQLNLWQMLRAATQPDSELDFKYPSETVTVVLKSKSPLRVSAPSMKQQRVGENEIQLTAVPTENHWFPLEVTLQNSSASEPALDVSWFTAEDSRRRALPLRRIFLPWAKVEIQTGEKVERTIPEIAGGNWLSGKRLFFGDQASCYKCHTFGGQGGKIGPDLSNLLQRDYASVMKDITQPSAAINPDHVAYNVELKNEESLSGVLVGSTETESKFADATGKITTVKKSEIASMKPSSISLMPEGLLEPLNAQQRKDLLTYLLMPPPLEPAPIEREGEPPARKLSDVNAILNGSSRGDSALTPAESKNSQSRLTSAAANVKALRIVLCDGPKDHGVNEHDYPVWKARWSKLFSLVEKVSVETADKWPTPEEFSKADVIVFYSDNPGWSAERASALDQFLNRGGGLVYLHYAIDGHKSCEELAQRVGLSWRGGFSKFRHGPIDLNFQSSPITEGFSTTHFVDESYWNLVGSQSNIQLIASGMEEGKTQPLMWTREQGKGRVFVSVPGHFTWTFDDPLFRILIFRGIAWTAHEPMDRFNDLVTIGARISE